MKRLMPSLTGGKPLTLAYNPDEPRVPAGQPGGGQWTTEPFKKWFEGSKVVDADGRPMVVYHGTSEKFTSFDPDRKGARDPGDYGKGFYFTASKANAEMYSEWAKGGGASKKRSRNVMAVYLAIKRPFVMKDDMDEATATAIVEDASANRVRLGKEPLSDLKGHAARLRSNFNSASEVVNKTKERARILSNYISTVGLERIGYDGIIGTNEIVAFRPSQIKSATGNRGTFDPGSDDIRMSFSLAQRSQPAPYIAQAVRMDLDMRKVEEAGVAASQRCLARIRSGFMRSLGSRGHYQFSAQAELLNHLVPVMAKTLACADLMGQRRALLNWREAGLEPIALDRFSEVQKMIRDAGLGRDMTKVQRGYARRVYKMMRDAGAKIDAVTRGTVANLIATNEPMGRGSAILQATLNKLGVGDYSQSQIETIYATEVARAYHTGRRQMDMRRWNDIWGFRYVTMRDDRVRPTHASWEGTVLKKGNRFWKTHWPPCGWNSVPPETPVMTPFGERPIAEIRHGDLVMTHKCRYRPVYELHRHEGPDELVTVTVTPSAVDGPRTLRLTGNHQVLTKRGWIEAAALNDADEVLCPLIASKVNKAGVNVDQVWDDAAIDNGPVPFSVRHSVVGLNFDPQAMIGQDEVDPIPAGWEIENEVNAAGLEMASEFGLGLRHAGLVVDVARRIVAEELFSGFGSFANDIWSPEGSAQPQGRFGLFDPQRVGLVGDDLSVRSLSEYYTPFSEQAAYSPELDAGFGGAVSEGAATGLVVSDERAQAAGPFAKPFFGPRGVGFGSVGLFSGHGGIVVASWVKIDRIGRSPWGRQMVYNLAVEEDDSYVAEGMALHNCRCQVVTIYKTPGYTPREVPPGKINGQVARADDGFGDNFAASVALSLAEV